MKDLALQLFSVRDHTEKSIVDAMKRVAGMGYTGVEFAGYGGLDVKSMKRVLDEFGLRALSSHVGYDGLTNHLDEELEYLAELGAKYIVCPGASINTVASALEYVELFNRIGEKAAKSGLVFAYHNHSHEFAPDNGQYPLEVLFENVDPRYVRQQPDLFWVAYAGLDVYAYLEKNVSRCPVIHLKQIENMQTKRNVNAGDGAIDFARVARLAPDADFVYEQEQYDEDSMECVRKSAEFLLKI